MKRKVHLVALALSLVACSNQSEPSAESGGRVGQMDGSTDRMADVSSASQLDGPDSASVARIVAAALRGERGIRDTLLLAVDRCALNNWERAVVAGIVKQSPASLGPYTLVGIAPALSEGLWRCEDLGLEAWLREALSLDLPAGWYADLAAGLADGLGRRVVAAVARDESANRVHRMAATEALVGRRASRNETVGPGRLTYRIARQYEFDRLAPPYVETWLPMLLAAPQTRETTAQDLIDAVIRWPSQMGAPEILRIVASNVEAYDYRFSSETRAHVSEALQELDGRRQDLPDGLAAALDAALRARTGGLNHLGTRIHREPLRLELTLVGDECLVTAPTSIVRALEATVPGFRVAEQDECRVDGIRRADFDGEGSDDALLRGSTDEGTVLLAVLTGGDSSAHIVSPLADSDWAYIHAPGTSATSCEGTFVFPDDWISVSYDEKYSATFRWNGVGFERLKGDEC